MIAHNSPRTMVQAGRSAPLASRRRASLSPFAALLLAALCFILTAAPAAADSRPPGGNFADPVVREIDIAAPAIVRVATVYTGHLTLFMCGAAVTLPASGPGYIAGGLGSGAFISANGDVLTADHVVDIDKLSLAASLFNNPTSAADIAAAINRSSCIHPDPPLTADDIVNGFAEFGDLLRIYKIGFTASFSAPRYLVWQNTAFTGPVTGGDKNSQSLIHALLDAPYQHATLVGSSAFENNDLAILHTDLLDTPSIQLDDSSQVAVEDRLTTIGFPGNGDANHPDGTYDTTDLLTPSVNNLTVSAVKATGSGSTLLQVAGSVEHGDSGGPAIDAAGHIVGVVSYSGTSDPIGSFFLRSSNDAQRLLASASVDTHPGAFQQLWRQAFMDYAGATPGHWHKAAAELDTLSARYPAFHGIQAYKAYAETAAALEAVPQAATTFTPLITWVVAAATAVAVLVLVVLIVLLRRRDARRARKVLPAVGSAPMYAYPYPMPGYSPPPSGGYLPPGPYASPQAQSIPPFPSAPPTDNQATGLNAAPGPMGQMTFPPLPDSSTQSDSPALDASAAPGMVAAAVAATPPGVPTPDPARAAPGWQPQMIPDPRIPLDGSGVCLNGHRMPPGELYCGFCGQPRRPAGPPFVPSP